MALACASSAPTLDDEARRPTVREATAIEVFNIPLFEIPPTLDVRSVTEFERSHMICAVSLPAEDGFDVAKVCQRILDHDDVYGWLPAQPMVIVYDSATRARAEWLMRLVRSATEARATVHDFEGADQAERLLRRFACQCPAILFLAHDEFAAAFSFCCSAGKEWAAASFFDSFGPLPCCPLLVPRIYLAGRQVNLTQQMLGALGVTHVVVNGDALDVMDGTSGGASGNPFQDRPTDVEGVCYLKCDVPDKQDDQDLPEIFEGVSNFLMRCAETGGVALIRIHGQSRTASVICAFLQISRGLSAEDAWHCFSRAGIKIDPSLVWWDALQRLSRTGRCLKDGRVDSPNANHAF